MTSDDGDRYIGRRVASIRIRRGLTQQVLADRVGLSRGMIAKYETGERIIDSRRQLYDLATALQVSVADLTGHAEDRHLSAASAFHAAAPRIEAALMSAGATDDDRDPESVDVLSLSADRALDLRMAGDLSTLATLLPSVITDSYRRTGMGSDADRDQAWSALARASFAAGLASKGLGLVSLAWNAARVTAEAAAACGDRVALAASEFVSSQVLLAMPGSVTASLARAQTAADKLQPELTVTDDGMQLYGMLHLQAALASAALGGDSASHLAEAREIAVRTGDAGRAMRLDFGPANAGVWGMSIALEEERGADAVALAGEVDPSALSTAERQARYYIELARGHSKECQYSEAMNALLRAEAIAPEYVRSRVIVRELVGYMLRRTRRDLSATQLSRLADRVGAVAAQH